MGMDTIYNNISIEGIHAVVPEKVIDNYVLAEQENDRKLKRLIKLIGVKRRHIVSDSQTITDLACISAERLIEKLQWDRNDIQILIYVTQTPEFESPSTAMLIQKKLCIGTDCLAFDINLGCSGYTTGLQVAASLLANCKEGAKALLLTADGAFLDRKEPHDAMLFGEAAAATALEKKENAADMYFTQHSDGRRYDVLLRKANENVYMDGEAVLEFTMSDVAQSIKGFRDLYKLEEDAIDYYVWHQAQQFLLQNLAIECNVPFEKLLISLQEYGNTSCASLPLTICANLQQFADREWIRFHLCGFGVGLAWGNAYITVNVKSIMPVSITGKSFGDYYVEE